MKKWFALCAATLLTCTAQAQDVKRCDGPGGKVTYAEICPSNTKQTTVTDKGLSVTQSDTNQRKAEADFQKRHASREATQSKERAEKRRAANAERALNMKEEKMRRELALKEERAKRGDSKPKKGKKSRKKSA